MKKHFAPLLLVMCLLLTFLTGCSAMRSFEKDLQVVLNVNGEYYGSYTVNIFNNAVVPEPRLAGSRFLGWSAQEGDTTLISKNLTLIRYDDIKQYASKDTLSLTLYAVFEEIPQRDLVVAWYAKTATSGLDQAAMDAFQEKMNEFLLSQGYKPGDMDIVIRAYNGNVADTCAQILKDGDVDIMLGWSTNKNLIETGGFVKGEDFLENVGGIAIGSKERHAARKTDTELSKLVFDWLQKEYSGEDETDYDLVIAWYDKAATSGLDQAVMDAFQEKLDAYLATQGYDVENLHILLRGYTGSVADSCAQIKEDGDVDIMIGWSTTKNLTESGGFTQGVDFLENVGKIKLGSKSRYAARKTDTELSELVYTWIQKTYSASSAKKPAKKTTPHYDLVIAWYDKPETSGLDDGYIEAFQEALEDFLASQGQHPSILLKGYTGGVSKSCGNIKKAGNVDIMIGWSTSRSLSESGGLVEGVDFKENNGGVTIGSKDRYAARKTDTELSKLVYAWILKEYGEAEEPEEPAETYDLVIAWYDKADTSGLDQAAMDAFQEKLNAYLTAQGQNPSELKILLRGYQGSVKGTCSAIQEDGDVDLMVGWSTTKNLTETGGFTEGKDFLENNGGVTIGSTERYAARNTDTDLSNLVYAWILKEYGPKDATEPTTPTEPEGDKLVIAWYDKADTSGLDAETMDAFGAKLGAYLTGEGHTVNVTLRGYEGNVGATCNDIKTDGDVDIMVGWGNTGNLTGTGGLVDGEDFLENVGDITIGTKARYAARLTDTELSVLVYSWIQDAYGKGATIPTDPEEPEPEPENLVVAWYAKTSTSGLDEEIMNAFGSNLAAYLTGQGHNVNLSLMPVYGNVADSCAAIKAAGNVDIMVGWGNTGNLTETGGLVDGEDFLENVGDITIGTKARYAARLTDTDLAKMAYAWILAAYNSDPAMELTDIADPTDSAELTDPADPAASDDTTKSDDTAEPEEATEGETPAEQETVETDKLTEPESPPQSDMPAEAEEPPEAEEPDDAEISILMFSWIQEQHCA